jgi:uncharacterized protein
LPKSRAWFDLLTPKQILFFSPVIDRLESSGIEVLATSRTYRELAPLAERAGLHLKFVGERGDRGPEEQLLAATRRQAEMIPLIKEFKPAVAISVASAVCARVAFGLGVRHLAVNDSPHSVIAGRLSLPLSYHLLCPWVIPVNSWRRFGLEKSQITTYHALDPAAWLKRKPIGGPIPDLDPRKKTITLRLPETDAPYLAASDKGWPDEILGGLIQAYPETNIVALCRYDYQVDEVKVKFGRRCIVPDEVVGGRDLLEASDLFIGMGGTMSAEAALMGVPTISAFQGNLFTDRYLTSVGLLRRSVEAHSVVKLAGRFLDRSFKTKLAKKAKAVLDSMEDPAAKVGDFVEEAVKQA